MLSLFKSNFIKLHLINSCSTSNFMFIYFFLVTCYLKIYLGSHILLVLRSFLIFATFCFTIFAFLSFFFSFILCFFVVYPILFLLFLLPLWQHQIFNFIQICIKFNMCKKRHFVKSSLLDLHLMNR